MQHINVVMTIEQAVAYFKVTISSFAESGFGDDYGNKVGSNA